MLLGEIQNPQPCFPNYSSASQISPAINLKVVQYFRKGKNKSMDYCFLELQNSSPTIQIIPTCNSVNPFMSYVVLVTPLKTLIKPRWLHSGFFPIKEGSLPKQESIVSFSLYTGTHVAESDVSLCCDWLELNSGWKRQKQFSGCVVDTEMDLGISPLEYLTYTPF